MSIFQPTNQPAQQNMQTTPQQQQKQSQQHQQQQPQLQPQQPQPQQQQQQRQQPNPANWPTPQAQPTLLSFYDDLDDSAFDQLPFY